MHPYFQTNCIILQMIFLPVLSIFLAQRRALDVPNYLVRYSRDVEFSTEIPVLTELDLYGCPLEAFGCLKCTVVCYVLL